MKKCPKCGEYVGDDVTRCFNCFYDFIAGPQERQNQEREKDDKAERINNLYEYKVVSVKDNEDGSADEARIAVILAEYAAKRWKLHSIYSNELGVNSSVKYDVRENATICQTIIVFERMLEKAAN